LSTSSWAAVNGHGSGVGSLIEWLAEPISGTKAGLVAVINTIIK
jgi:hypothetical protein